MANLAKNNKIKETYAATMLRRQSQFVKVVTVKVQENKLNSVQREALKMMFVEAKWLRNHILSLSQNVNTNIFNLNYTDIPVVKHYDKDKNELETPLCFLSSQMKQDVLGQIKQDISNLAKAKKKGNNVGALKFISEYKSINLKQANVSYKIVGKSKVKVQGIKKPLKVNGLEQLSRFGKYDLANAKLLLKPSGYYIAITVMVSIKEKPQYDKSTVIGIDMGCSNSFTLSDGRKFSFNVEESERVKSIQRKLANAKKGSNNRWKLKKQLRKAYEKDTNRRNDMANKFCSMLKNFHVVIQDEQLASWSENGHGEKVQHSILGRVKSKLIMDGATVLSQWIPTTKFCPICGNKNDIHLWNRTYKCPYCGTSEDRDVHAARNMVWFYQNIVGVERTEYQLEDFEEAVKQHFQMKQEAAESLVQR